MMAGILKPGRTRPAAQAELEIVARRLQQQFPDSHKDHGIAVKSFHEAMNGGPIRLVFSLMMGAVGFVRLIVCANVANMLLGRALSRGREIGVRLALGAGSGAILRMVLHRGLPQIGIGLALGLTAAYFLCRLMAGLLLKVSPSDPITFGFASLTLFSAGIHPLNALHHD